MTPRQEADAADLAAACWWATKDIPGADAQAACETEDGWLLHHTRRAMTHPCGLTRFERITILFTYQEWATVCLLLEQLKAVR